MVDPTLRSVAGANCAIWREAPSLGDLRSAAIGRLAISDPEAGRRLLAEVCTELKAEGFAAALAPMDGDTWHSYRTVIHSDGSPPFAMEPVSGPHDAAALAATGFAPVSEYVSARAPVAGPDEADLPDDGLRIEAWNGEGAEALLAHAFRASSAAFARNRFYRPISQAEFLAMYLPLVPRLDPRLILFARDASGAIVGFLFGFPDYLAPQDRRCAVLKTYASLARGAGHRLAHKFHLVARDLGYAGVIHALMHVENASLDRSGRHGGAIVRRYALMGRTL